MEGRSGQAQQPVRDGPTESTRWLKHSDAALVQAAVNDPEALGELYRRHVGAIHRFFLARAPAREAPDLTAETFAQVALSLHRFEDRAGGSAAPWLFGIARNLLLRYFDREQVDERARKKLGLPVEIATGADEEIDARIDAIDAAQRLASALQTLGERDAAAVQLRVIDDLSYAEVGTALGCSEAAARIRVMRALRRLSAVFEPTHTRS